MGGGGGGGVRQLGGEAHVFEKNACKMTYCAYEYSRTQAGKQNFVLHNEYVLLIKRYVMGPPPPPGVEKEGRKGGSVVFL